MAGTFFANPLARCSNADTIRPIPDLWSMAAELKLADSTQRLANQLQTLSEVAEALTFRMLELEERFNSQVAGPIAADPEIHLGDTEERLARIEALLTAPAACQAVAPAIALEPDLFSTQEIQPEVQSEMQAEFEEEPEQSFMDELCA